MKAFFKRVRQYVEKKKWEVCIPSKQMMKKGLSLNQKIEFGCICLKRGFLDVGNQNWWLEKMVHSNSLKESMPTKWIYKVSIILVLYSKFLILICLMLVMIRGWMLLRIEKMMRSWLQHQGIHLECPLGLF